MDMRQLAIFVPGVPRTKGSLELRNRSTGALAGDRFEKQWAAMVTRKALDAWAGGAPLEGPIAVRLLFAMPTESVIVNGPGAGDLDKLERSILDAITKAKVWRDDVQVTSLSSRKVAAGAGVGRMQSGVTIQIQQDQGQ
jgi:Holliday junction resolvase RusA-like endonuclease